MNSVEESLLALFQRLESTGVPCMIGGAVAAVVYGEPRSTLDIDLIIRASPADAARIEGAFPRTEFYLPPTATLERELGRERDGSFQILDLQSSLKADVYIAGADPMIAWGLSHRRGHTIHGRHIWVAPATYVIAMKLRYYTISEQDKHLRDIRSILAISPHEVDVDSVSDWAAACGAEAAWNRCRSSPGEEAPGFREV